VKSLRITVAMIPALRAPIALAIAGAATLTAPARAQTSLAADFPGRPVTFVVPGPVGGITDTLCRMVADRLRRPFGHPVVVDNRPGAVGSIGASVVASAQPTGHTLLCTPDAPIVLSPLINKGLPYDPKAFEPVISLAITYSIVAVRRDFPAVSVAELIAYAKANPKKLNYATGGNGSNSYVATAWFARTAAVEMVNIPYAGSAPSLRALLGGEVDLLIDSLSVLLPAYRGGLARILAVGAPARLAEMPEVPTLAQVGLADMEFVNWYGIFAPPRTPAPTIAKLNRAVNDTLALPEMRAAIDAMALRAVGGTPLEFGEAIAQDRRRRGELPGGAVAPR
jgi:tripartite-type tricarboxylate transporter receptor subunit TctC